MIVKEQSKKSEKNNAIVVSAESESHTETTQLFNSINSNGTGLMSMNRFWRVLHKSGILQDDPRLKNVILYLNEEKILDDEQSSINLEQFSHIINHNTFVRNALKGNLVIPDFKGFCEDVEEIYLETKKIKEGNVATYIPQLARVNPDLYAISVCTVDGQRFSIGDAEEMFCLQSTSKPITYCIALEELGEDVVHQHVGREPSGVVFNAITLNNKGLPHNPLINAGAIMSCALISQNKDTADVFDGVTNTWKKLCGNKKPGFNNSVYLSEKSTADRNFALAYFMRENKGFPANTKIQETLEFYFQCCSIELTSDMMSIAAATLANAGVSPFSGEKIFSPKTVQNTLSLMSSCGMYDYSGEFAFSIGLPAKSGVSGALMVVIPKVMGICIWSPRLDKIGNSVKGIEFCKKLVERYNFHNYDIISGSTTKKDPRLNKYEFQSKNIVSLIWAATYGDIDEIQRLEANGVDLNAADYDGRTALHLACAEGRLKTAEYLISKGVNINPVDRWGGTPQQDAIKANHKEVAQLFETKLKK